MTAPMEEWHFGSKHQGPIFDVNLHGLALVCLSIGSQSGASMRREAIRGAIAAAVCVLAGIGACGQSSETVPPGTGAHPVDTTATSTPNAATAVFGGPAC